MKWLLYQLKLENSDNCHMWDIWMDSKYEHEKDKMINVKIIWIILFCLKR